MSLFNSFAKRIKKISNVVKKMNEKRNYEIERRYEKVKRKEERQKQIRKTPVSSKEDKEKIKISNIKQKKANKINDEKLFKGDLAKGREKNENGNSKKEVKTRVVKDEMEKMNVREVEKISKSIMERSREEEEVFAKKMRRNSLKRMIPMKDRDDRLANFIKGKRKLTIKELFMFYNPNNPKLMFLMIDYFGKCNLGGKKTWFPSDVVTYKELRSFYYNNYEIDLRKCGDDINLISLQIFCGEVAFSNLIVSQKMLRNKWNVETIAMLEYKNDFTVIIK